MRFSFPVMLITISALLLLNTKCQESLQFPVSFWSYAATTAVVVEGKIVVLCFNDRSFHPIVLLFYFCFRGGVFKQIFPKAQATFYWTEQDKVTLVSVTGFCLAEASKKSKGKIIG